MPNGGLMSGRERVLRTLEGEETDRVPFGIFGTSSENECRMAADLGLTSVDALYEALGLDIWHIPENRTLTYTGPARVHHGLAADWWGVPYEARRYGNSGDACPLKDIKSVEEVEAYRWPDVSDFASTELERILDRYARKGYCVEGGLWAPIFHNVTWLCGFETTMTNLIEQPEVSHAMIRRVADFWINFCKRMLDAAKGRISIMQNCNDFGSQRGLIMSPEMFRVFFRQPLQRLYDTIHSYGVKVMQHSCGAVSGLIGDFIEMGADIINPVQVSADGMEPAGLFARYGDRACFYGGIDTQHVLPEGPVRRVREATRKTLEIFRNGRYILGPSQGIEGDIPTRNVTAMFEEGRRYQLIPRGLEPPLFHTGNTRKEGKPR